MKKKNAGFGLLENLVSLAVFAILLTIGGAIFYLSLRGQTTALLNKELRQDGSNAVAAIEDYLYRFAAYPRDCPFSNRSSLTLVGADGRLTTFSCQNNNLASNSASLIPATVKCTSFQASCQRLSSSYPQVTVSFTLATSGNDVNQYKIIPAKKEANFSLTVVLKEKI